MVGEAKKICNACGKIHVTRHGAVACHAHIAGSDRKTPCSVPPIRGGKVCRFHGGAIGATQRKAAQRLIIMDAEGEIADLMRACDIPDQHPIDGLLECVRVSGAMMRLLTIKVGELHEEPTITEVLIEGPGDALTTKNVSTNDAFWGLDAKEEMAPSVFVSLLKVWTERYEKACKTALDAGIEERRIQLAEDTTEVFFKALNNAVAVAGLDPAVREALHTALALELRKNTPELKA